MKTYRNNPSYTLSVLDNTLALDELTRRLGGEDMVDRFRDDVLTVLTSPCNHNAEQELVTENDLMKSLKGDRFAPVRLARRWSLPSGFRLYCDLDIYAVLTTLGFTVEVVSSSSTRRAVATIISLTETSHSLIG